MAKYTVDDYKANAKSKTAKDSLKAQGRSRSRNSIESILQSAVMDYARLKGWRQIHFKPAQVRGQWVTALVGDSGFPDLVCVRGGRLLFVEFKSDKGRLSADQEAWREALERLEGVEYYLVTPEYWSSGQIEGLLD